MNWVQLAVIVGGVGAMLWVTAWEVRHDRPEAARWMWLLSFVMILPSWSVCMSASGL